MPTKKVFLQLPQTPHSQLCLPSDSSSSPALSSFLLLLLLLSLGLFTDASVARCWGVDFGFYAAHTHKLYERHISRLILIVAKLWLSSKNCPCPLASQPLCLSAPSSSRATAPHASVFKMPLMAGRQADPGIFLLSPSPLPPLLYFPSWHSGCKKVANQFVLKYFYSFFYF